MARLGAALTKRTDLQAAVRKERQRIAEEAFAVPSMLSGDELAALHWAARTRDAEGTIVDAGCFLGGSTLSLALGARQSGRSTKVHSFDLFQVGDKRERIYFEPSFPFAIGASTIEAFRANIAPVGDIVVVHQGDINQLSGWSEDVSVLFIDITKSWETNDTVVSNFFPRLVPGSLVIQQDLVHFGHPWCALTMELLSEHFEYLGHVKYSSALYRTTSPIDPDELPLKLLEHVPADDGVRLMEQTAERVGEPQEAFLRLAAAILLTFHGQLDRASRIADEVGEKYSEQTLPFFSEQLSMTRGFIAGHTRSWPARA